MTECVRVRVRGHLPSPFYYARHGVNIALPSFAAGSCFDARQLITLSFSPFINIHYAAAANCQRVPALDDAIVFSSPALRFTLPEGAF